MAEKLVIFDLEGALLERPPEGKVSRVDQIELVPGVIPALLRLEQAGFRSILIGARQQPAVIDRLRRLFGSQGVSFSRILLCPHVVGEVCGCPKPGTELLRELVQDQSWDRAASAVVGDGEADLELARNLGVAGYRICVDGGPTESWSHVAHVLADRPRVAFVERVTRETVVSVAVDLDARDEPDISTGLGFLDHMLEQLGKHGGFKLEVACRGDLNVDEHHTVEDVALTIGEALRRALGDKRGLERYGFLLPMDETAAEVAIDLGGRPYLVFEGTFTRERVGDLPTELVPHFFQSLAQTLGAAVHLRVRGENNHHMIEACFKGFARALRSAVARDGPDLPSTKGRL